MFFVHAEEMEMETRNFYEYEKPLWPAELTNFKQNITKRDEERNKSRNVIRAQSKRLTLYVDALSIDHIICVS